jgi:hypothetical protein
MWLRWEGQKSGAAKPNDPVAWLVRLHLSFNRSQQRRHQTDVNCTGIGSTEIAQHGDFAFSTRHDDCNTASTGAMKYIQESDREGTGNASCCDTMDFAIILRASGGRAAKRNTPILPSREGMG